jgi:hypothetical protein
VQRHFLAKDEFRGRVLGSLALGVILVRTVDAVEANAFNVGVVQDFDGIPVDHADSLAGELRCGKGSRVKSDPAL